MPFESVKLNDGNEVPAIGFGTGTVLRDHDATESVARALKTGFKHIDTAQIYHNEESVGLAIKESSIARSDLFVTTKYSSGSIQESVRASLGRLGLRHVDLYLIHSPIFVEPDFEGSWKELEKIKDEGLARSIGVSNYNLKQLQTVVKTCRIKPAIAFHPYNHDENKPLLEYSAKHNIIIEGFSSLTPITKYPGGPVDTPVNAAARRRGVAPSQIILAWVRAKGVVIITTSSNKQHLQQYLAVADMVVAGPGVPWNLNNILIWTILDPLTEAEIAAIDKAGAKGPPPMGLGGDRFSDF